MDREAPGRAGELSGLSSFATEYHILFVACEPQRDVELGSSGLSEVNDLDVALAVTQPCSLRILYRKLVLKSLLISTQNSQKAQ